MGDYKFQKEATKGFLYVPLFVASRLGFKMSIDTWIVNVN